MRWCNWAWARARIATALDLEEGLVFLKSRYGAHRGGCRPQGLTSLGPGASSVNAARRTDPQYRTAFLRLPARREEAALTRGYELGRGAVTAGISMLDLTRIHRPRVPCPIRRGIHSALSFTWHVDRIPKMRTLEPGLHDVRRASMRAAGSGPARRTCRLARSLPGRGPRHTSGVRWSSWVQGGRASAGRPSPGRS